MQPSLEAAATLSVPSIEEARVAFACAKEFLGPSQGADVSALRERLSVALLVM